MRCAQVLNGVVVNVIEADPASFAPGDGSVIVGSDTAQCGDAYANGVFTPAPAAAPPPINGLSLLQFMALFTPAEQAAIASASDPQTRVFTLMASGAQTLDLDDGELIAGVQHLVSVGLLAPGRAAAILAGAAPQT
jgi:hypothetical protein